MRMVVVPSGFLSDHEGSVKRVDSYECHVILFGPDLLRRPSERGVAWADTSPVKLNLDAHTIINSETTLSFPLG